MDTGENMNTGLRCFLTPTVCPTIQFYCDANYLGLASDSTGFKGSGPQSFPHLQPLSKGRSRGPNQKYWVPWLSALLT